MAQGKKMIKRSIRLDADLYERIVQIAEDQKRTVQAQIEVMLADAAKRARLKSES